MSGGLLRKARGPPLEVIDGRLVVELDGAIRIVAPAILVAAELGVGDNLPLAPRQWLHREECRPMSAANSSCASGQPLRSASVPPSLAMSACDGSMHAINSKSDRSPKTGSTKASIGAAAKA